MHFSVRNVGHSFEMRSVGPKKTVLFRKRSLAITTNYSLSTKTYLTMHVYFFGQGRADGGSEVRNIVGGKGASLGDMTRAGLNVPPGFTLSAECCAYYFEHDRRWPEGLENEVRENLAKLEAIAGRKFGRGNDPLLVAVRSGAAQSMPGMMDTVLNVGLNPEVVREIGERTRHPRSAWEAYYHFLGMFSRTVAGIWEKDWQAAVQRYFSTHGFAHEDDLDATALERLCLHLMTFFEEFTKHPFPTDPWTMLHAAIEAVFRSWHSERAVMYRQHHRISGLNGTAVNVQIMCPSEVAGVLFTANPVNPDLPHMVLEASFGLGESVVLGKVTPDRFVIHRDTLQILERNLGRKEQKLSAVVDGTPSSVSSQSVTLNDEQVVELAQLGKKVEAYFNVPCDIEWGLSRGAFYLLQSRAIKFSKEAAKPTFTQVEKERVRTEEIEALRQRVERTGTVWSRFNLSEILPEPTPMTWVIVREFMSGQGGFGQMYRDLGFDPDPALNTEGIFDLIGGRPYCNLSREPRMQYKDLPFEHPFDALKKNPAKALYPQAVMNPRRAHWRFWLTIPLLFFKLFRSNLKLRHYARTFAETFERHIVPTYLAEVNKAQAEDWSQKSPHELLSLLNYWRKRTLFDFARESLKPTALTGITLGNLERYLARRFQPPGPPNPLAGLPRAQAAIRELVMGLHPDEASDLPGGIKAFQLKKLSKAEFLSKFGHRGSYEMELARPRWSEDPAAVDRLVDGATAHPHAQSPMTPHWHETWRKIADEARILPGLRRPVEAEIETLFTYLRLRETAKHQLMRGYALIRRALLELDRRYQLDTGIFYLTPDELPSLLESAPGPAPTVWREKIAERRKRRQIALSLPVPQVIFSDDLDAIGREETLAAADVMQGVPLSAGTSEAIAWVLEETTQAKPPSDAYILVCPSTDPAWLPLFVDAKGLVMETGGVLSHGAIVAREFGLPAVAGIPDVHRILRTGQRLRIDGGTGKVEVLA